jgi:hypothetical protein
LLSIARQVDGIVSGGQRLKRTAKVLMIDVVLTEEMGNIWPARIRPYMQKGRAERTCRKDVQKKYVEN